MPVDPQRSQLPDVEPTPDSPPATQTSPITPDVPAVAADGPQPVPGQPTQPVPPLNKPPLTPRQTMPKLGSHKKLLAAIITAVILIGGLIFLFLSPWSPFVAAAPSGPQLMVGTNKYRNACNVFDKELVAKELGIKSDLSKENVSESLAYDPANTKDKQVDLTKKTDSESVLSGCTLKLDREQTGEGDQQKTSFINVSLALEQFPDTDKASKAFKESRQKVAGPKTLPSFKDTSYYNPPKGSTAGQTVRMQPKILHENMIISLAAPISGDDAAQNKKDAGRLDTIAEDVVNRIARHEGDKPKNFNGINKLGDTKFTDACLSVNYAKVAAAMGNNTEFNIKTVNGNQAYAPDNNGGKQPSQIISGCIFTFRTQYEIDQINAPKTTDKAESTLTYEDKFPHYLSLQITATESQAKAKELIDAARKQGQQNVKQKNTENDTATMQDVSIGDGGITLTLAQKYRDGDSTPGSESLAQLYYIQKGPMVYILATTYVKGEEQYKSETRTLSLDQVKKIYKEMTIATKRAN